MKAILFDLDGTLVDSGEGIMKSVQYALEAFGIQEEDASKLKRFVGPPLIHSFTTFYNLSEEEARFCQEFACNTGQNPFTAILKNLFLLTNKN